MALAEDTLAGRFMALMPSGVDHCAMRHMTETGEQLLVRNGVVEPIHSSVDGGVLVTVWAGGGHGYAASPDTSDDGIRRAIATATQWAHRTAGIGAVSTPPTADRSGEYHSPVANAWSATSLADRVDLLRTHEAALRTDDRIVDSHAFLGHRTIETLFVTSDGAVVHQSQDHVMPDLRVVAHADGMTQIRSYGSFSMMGQGGLEVLDRHGFGEAAPRLVDEAIELLTAPNCPTETMDLLLAPDQMVLQIHESIGHPLELDRILGDERNFAGTSFVTQDMFGTFQYGSPLLNVTFDPTVEGQFASYAFDDEGTPATRQHLIRDGVLERPLGGASSQRRADMDGVANSRSSAWNRAPIDRMANLNVEPGDQSFDDLVGGIERGVFLETNTSWSIDDSRNKFQFSCERGTLIENGELTTVVRNPSYRSVSREFWRSLSGVGDPSTFKVMGVPNCGKGEPSQVIWVGHASPPCRFSDVEVFGADS